MRIACGFTLILIALSMLSCAQPRTRSQESKAIKKSVSVIIRGEVKNPDKHYIENTFSVNGIRDAGGGWADEYDDFPTQAFVLTRIVKGANKKWKVRFDEINTLKWRGVYL